MRFWSVAPLVAAAFATVSSSGGPASAQTVTRISGPHIYENLALYFVHGPSAPGRVPLTLQEALEKGSVSVIETGRVNELQIENNGTDEIFIQAGDIVKGGRQDRVLTVSFILPPKSGRLPIASFCVEQGRWTARGKEDQAKFSSAREAMPSVFALRSMATPLAEYRPAGQAGAMAGLSSEQADTAVKQRKVWDSVAATQNKLAEGLKGSVNSAQSASSLQLSLENEKLKAARHQYLMVLHAEGLKEADVIGYVAAINGKMSVANVYPSNALFQKMWDKLLAASVTEAIGEKVESAKPEPAPAPASAKEFLAAAEKGRAQERALPAGIKQETRDAESALYSETRAVDGKWVHRSYMAK